MRNLPDLDPEEILATIAEWVETESPTSDAEAVNRCIGKADSLCRAFGLTTERTPGRDGYGDILSAADPGADGEGILVLSHLDTVHPHGTLGRNPFRREGDRVFGPGIYDMKGGACLALYACRSARRDDPQSLPVRFLFLPDEEVGSPTSREAIEREAARAKYVLVTEPAREGGKIVTGRKGVARYGVTAHGRPAHSGLRHQDGRSAVREMAHQILAIEALTDYGRGLTANVGLISGGTGANVVPAHCRIEVDVRVADMASARFVEERMRSLSSSDPEVRLVVEGGLNRPPFEKSPEIERLYQTARTLAGEIGFDLVDMTTGGGSDGNFTAAMGIPTLDGLGVDGAGAHTEEEHMLFSSIAPRGRLMKRLFETLR